MPLIRKGRGKGGGKEGEKEGRNEVSKEGRKYGRKEDDTKLWAKRESLLRYHRNVK